jgi:hypothetical protein
MAEAEFKNKDMAWKHHGYSKTIYVSGVMRRGNYGLARSF